MQGMLVRLGLGAPAHMAHMDMPQVNSHDAADYSWCSTSCITTCTTITHIWTSMITTDAATTLQAECSAAQPTTWGWPTAFGTCCCGWP